MEPLELQTELGLKCEGSALPTKVQVQRIPSVLGSIRTAKVSTVSKYIRAFIPLAAPPLWNKWAHSFREILPLICHRMQVFQMLPLARSDKMRVDHLHRHCTGAAIIPWEMHTCTRSHKCLKTLIRHALNNRPVKRSMGNTCTLLGWPKVIMIGIKHRTEDKGDEEVEAEEHHGMDTNHTHGMRMTDTMDKPKAINEV